MILVLCFQLHKLHDSKMAHRWPTLVKINAHGKQQCWEIWTKQNVIHRSIYQTNGKVRLLELIDCKGKNIGKANETSDTQQAKNEAQSLWEKKQNREGYSVRSANDGEPLIATVAVKPMLAKSYEDEKHKVTFPVSIQPKLDGIRVLLKMDTKTGGIVAVSRKNTNYPFLTHIKKDAKILLANLPAGMILDGEVYCQGMSCQEIAGIVATKLKPHAEEQKLYYVVFDWISGTKDSYQSRYDRFSSVFGRFSLPNIRLIQTETASTDAEMEQWHAEFSKTYEGSIIRQPKSAYESKRSSNLLKWKTFQDAEFKIVDVVDGIGQDQGCATMIVEMPKTKQQFHARMMGTLEQRQNYFTNRDMCIGKMLTVKYQELTDDGIPRFPVGICIRDYE